MAKPQRRVLYHCLYSIFEVRNADPNRVFDYPDPQTGRTRTAKSLGFTHEIVLATTKSATGSSFINGMHSQLANPAIIPGVMISWAGCPEIDRPSQSEAIYVNDKWYYKMTWTDVLGSGHSKQSGLRRREKYRSILFCREATPEDSIILSELLGTVSMGVY